MSKGLEALHHPRIELAKIDISAESKHDIAYMPFYKTKQYVTIEKELKALEILKAFDFEIEDYTNELNGSVCVKQRRIILDPEEIDLLKEVLL